MEISLDLLAWYDAGHRDLPWRRTRDPYSIWVSEIMLQQTRVETVLSYYERFICRLPDVRALADVPEEELLKLWEGLGYYSRARNLQRAAQQVMADFGGEMPTTYEALRRLSGIGPYTAGAIASMAFRQRVPAVDGNVQRVISRLYGIREDIGIPSVTRALAEKAGALVPADRPGDLNNAVMELGALVCIPGRPRCGECPVQAACDAYREGDAASLPVKQKKAGQRIEQQAVALVFCGRRVLVRKRRQRLLQGLWLFPMAEGVTSAAKLREALRGVGLSPDTGKYLGEAKHVFTHIIWQMRIYAFEVKQMPEIADGQWVTLEELVQLPIPTAVRAARQHAAKMLEQKA